MGRWVMSQRPLTLTAALGIGDYHPIAATGLGCVHGLVGATNEGLVIQFPRICRDTDVTVSENRPP